MWLIDLSCMSLKKFPDKNGRTPPYAILSHVWGNSETEVSFHQLLDKSQRRFATFRFKKLVSFCHFAAREGYGWVWLDTCCIDQSSSTELSEGINSMWALYRDAEVCYAFLQDVDYAEDPGSSGSSFRRSRWFTRGWTLQELIAPGIVVFVAEGRHMTDDMLGWPGWLRIGTRAGLGEVIQDITGINLEILHQRADVDSLGVAQRMSWAAQRQTTRPEDRAYSLMGIFGVTMPAIYGEGDRAFTRLQLEILKQSSDQSLLVWGSFHSFSALKNGLVLPESFGPGPSRASGSRGLLATSPSLFAGCAHVHPLSTRSISSLLNIPMTVPESSPTNAGIRMHLPMYDLQHPHLPALRLVFLACEYEGNLVCLILQGKPDTVHQYHVGLYRATAVEGEPQHPPYRVFLIPRAAIARGIEPLLNSLRWPTPLPPTKPTLPVLRGMGRILRLRPASHASSSAQRAVQTCDMYIHSHNTDFKPRQGQKTADISSSPPPSLTLIIPGWVQARLLQSGFSLVGGVPEWRPIAERKSPRGTPMAVSPGCLAVTLPFVPGERAVALFREDQGDETFAVSFGLLAHGALWADVCSKNAEVPDTGDGTLWASRPDEVAKMLWTRNAEKDQRLHAVAQWSAGEREWTNAAGKGRDVRVGVVMSGTHPSKLGMEYTVSIHIGSSTADIVTLGEPAVAAHTSHTLLRAPIHYNKWTAQYLRPLMHVM